jgi:hypothetical protein
MRIGVTLVVLATTASARAAPEVSVEGVVVDANSRWTGDHSRIVTEATVRTPSGDVVVSQLGGSVDGLTMRTFPGPEILVPGMRVAVSAHEGVDLAQRTHVVVDDLRVLDDPSGFVRTGPTKAGRYLFWESGCVLVTVDADGTKEVAGNLEFDAIDASIDEWNTNTSACSYMHIVKNATEAHEVGNDGRNMIKFRDQSWCRPAINDDPARCYSPSAAGLTTAVFVDDKTSSRDGAIVDADVELNGVDFAISVAGQSTGTASCMSEVGNTLTHELGHLQGLEHPCLASGDPPRQDGDGNPVPLCAVTTDPKIIEATMYNFQDCGETKKEDLTADDISGICKTYPLANDPKTCGPPGGNDGGCCIASVGSSHGWPATVLLGGLTTLLVLLRRKRSHAV